jgi:hypothetical protein
MATHGGIAGRCERTGLVIALVAAGLYTAATAEESGKGDTAAPKGTGSLTITVPPASAPPPPVIPPFPKGTGQASVPVPPAAAPQAPAPAAPTAPQAEVPRECFNPDGSINQAGIAAWQRKRLETINQEENLQYRLSETPHFLFLSGLGGPGTERFQQWAESLYRACHNELGLDPGVSAWDGKGMVLLFASRAPMDEHFRRIGRQPPADHGTHILESRQPAAQMPQTVRVYVEPGGMDERELRWVFARDVVCPFFDLFGRGPRLPCWLHEGIVLYIWCLGTPGAGPALWRQAQDRIPYVTSASQVLTQSRADFPKENRTCTFAVVDYLLKTGKPKFGQLLALLKEGKDQETALRTAYKVGPDVLLAQWKAYAASLAKTPAPAPAKTGKGVELSATCLNVDGTLNQKAIVDAQKKWLETINREMPAQLHLVETPHFLIFSDADGPTTDKYKRWCELLFSSLSDNLMIVRTGRVWDGKCALLLFTTKAQFTRFARCIDDSDHAAAAAYFVWERRLPAETAPQLAHICLCLEGHDESRMRSIFAHEGTHAFLELVRRGEPMPLWLHEGLATYMSVVNDPTLGPAMKALVQQRLAKGNTYAGILSGATTQLTEDEYCAAYSMVDFLFKTSPTSFKELLSRMKEGTTTDMALKAAYGYDSQELVKRWQKHMAAFVAPRTR